MTWHQGGISRDLDGLLNFCSGPAITRSPPLHKCRRLHGDPGLLPPPGCNQEVTLHPAPPRLRTGTRSPLFTPQPCPSPSREGEGAGLNARRRPSSEPGGSQAAVSARETPRPQVRSRRARACTGAQGKVTAVTPPHVSEGRGISALAPLRLHS